MRPLSRTLLATVICLGALMVAIALFHLDETLLAVHIGQFFPLVGAATGGLLALIAASAPRVRRGSAEPWLGYERLAWTLIGLGIILWGAGEGYRLYALATVPSASPALASIGTASLPLLLFLGLLLQPPATAGRARLLMFLDSLIALGAILGIAWSLFGAELAQIALTTDLATLTTLYFLATDLALLNCVALLLMRSQGAPYQAFARRRSLFMLALGLALFAIPDLLWHLPQHTGSPFAHMPWLALGWPLGLMTIGLAAYLRRFLAATSEAQIVRRIQRHARRTSIGFAQLVPHALLVALFAILFLTVFLQGNEQRVIRIALLLITLLIVIVRQLLTISDGERLKRWSDGIHEQNEMEMRQLEGQARAASQRNTALEMGLAHLKEVQARLANGDLRARARLTDGDLVPLAGTLNLLADRLMRLEQWSIQAQRLKAALEDLSMALEQTPTGQPFTVPASCKDFPEINRLLLSLGLPQGAASLRPAVPPALSALTPQARPARQEEPRTDPLPPPLPAQVDPYAPHIEAALYDLNTAIERYHRGEPFVVPASCATIPEINRLLFVTGLRQHVDAAQPVAQSAKGLHTIEPLGPSPRVPRAALPPTQLAASSRATSALSGNPFAAAPSPQPVQRPTIVTSPAQPISVPPVSMPLSPSAPMPALSVDQQITGPIKPWSSLHTRSSLRRASAQPIDEAEA